MLLYNKLSIGCGCALRHLSLNSLLSTQDWSREVIWKWELCGKIIEYGWFVQNVPTYFFFHIKTPPKNYIRLSDSLFVLLFIFFNLLIKLLPIKTFIMSSTICKWLIKTIILVFSYGNIDFFNIITNFIFVMISKLLWKFLLDNLDEVLQLRINSNSNPI